jgi:hypothetical protein
VRAVRGQTRGIEEDEHAWQILIAHAGSRLLSR